MTHDEYMAELAAIKARNLRPHEVFEAQILLSMRNYWTSLPLVDSLGLLIEYHGLVAVQKAVAEIAAEG